MFSRASEAERERLVSSLEPMIENYNILFDELTGEGSCIFLTFLSFLFLLIPEDNFFSFLLQR